MDDRIWKIGLNLLENVGPILAKKLVAYTGSPEAVFKEKATHLMKIPDVGQVVAHSVVNAQIVKRAEQELQFMEMHDVEMLFYTDAGYPERLSHCPDAPVLLYKKGAIDLNKHRSIAVVGTRKASPYGNAVCKQLIEELSAYNCMVVSGLAYGIDSIAHRAALDNQLPTVAVLGHGLDRVYPAMNERLAEEMITTGGWLTEFESGTNPDRENFPKRNRIVAGLCDGLIVIESGLKGGSMITAHLANDYNREVFAVPGKLNDPLSAGCNRLIKTHKAVVIESAEDIEYLLGWQKVASKTEVEKAPVKGLEPIELKVCTSLHEKGTLNIDDLAETTGNSTGELASVLLGLECDGWVVSSPGQHYALLRPLSV